MSGKDSKNLLYYVLSETVNERNFKFDMVITLKGKCDHKTIVKNIKILKCAGRRNVLKLRFL